MATDKERSVTCQGCGTSSTTFMQCPLCEAEGATDRGFFCSQECFAKNWLEHRNTLHKSGVVREKKKPAAGAEAQTSEDAAAEGKSKKAKKRARDAAATAAAAEGLQTEDERDGAAAVKIFAPWPALPSAELCAQKQWATISPALSLDAPRAVVRPASIAGTAPSSSATKSSTRGSTTLPSPSSPTAATTITPAAATATLEDASSYFWSALVAAAHYTHASLRQNPRLRVLVVAGDVYSAHAFAWAARCAGLSGALQLCVSESTIATSFLTQEAAQSTEKSIKEESSEDAGDATSTRQSPSLNFTAHRRIVIATAAVVRAAAAQGAASASAISGAASAWLTGNPADGRLITLPDVVEPADLQGVQTRAVFFTGPHGTGEEEEAEEESDNADHAANVERGAEGNAPTGYTYSNVEASYEDGTPLRYTPVIYAAPGTSTTTTTTAEAAESSELPDAEAATTAELPTNDARLLPAFHGPASRLDDEVCTCYANGDLAGALHRLVRLYTHHPGYFESSLFYVLCLNWGAANLVHAHHRLAYAVRFFCDQSARVDGKKKNASLADAALRAVTAAVKLLPRMRDPVAEATATTNKTEDTTAGEENAKTGSGKTNAKGKKAQKTEGGSSSVSASAAVAATFHSNTAMPTLASTTRPTPLVDGVSAPSSLEVSRLANYYTHLPNLQLQATVCYLYGVASPAVLDAFAQAWGIFRYVPGAACLSDVEKARSAAVLRVRQRYTTKLDASHANFYVVLMQFLYDAVGPYSLSVEEVRRRLVWDLTLAHDAGSLETYLQCCALLPNKEGLLLPTARKQKAKKAVEATASAEGNANNSSSTNSTPVPSLSSRQTHLGKRETVQSRTAALRIFAVKTTVSADKNYGFIELPYKHFPITGERQRQIDRLHTSAVEEVLMAMPRVPRPMYVGDIGNLIGKWAHFNARFDGVLGATLQVFLEAHPEAFRVVDRLVTRRTAGTTEQVRVRFDAEDDNNNNNDDSEDEHGNRRKSRDRQLLTGQKGKDGKQNVELPARARKKRAVKEFNKERFNRNYKSIDASARVPGYVKRGPRRIKGRGKKANKRVVKRGN